MIIGCNPTNNSCFNGLFDELRIWKVARTATEIHDSYNKPVATDSADLVGYWKFDEASGTTTADAVTTTGHTAHNGTLTASATGQTPDVRRAPRAAAPRLPLTFAGAAPLPSAAQQPIGWVAGGEPCEEQFSTARATCASRSAPTRRSSSRRTPSSGSRRPASAGPTCGPTAASTRSTQPTPMGHEYCGIVEEVGSAVTSVKPGQFVIGSFFASDNTCPHCQAGYQTSCQHREFVSGAQAPLLRVPLADGTLVADARCPLGRPDPEPAGALRRHGHRLVRRRRGQREARHDGRGRRRRRGRPARRALGQADGRGADHRDEPARAAAEARARVRRDRHRDRARRRGRRAHQGADRRASAPTRCSSASARRSR